jgi:glutathione peroxidase-family protein
MKRFFRILLVAMVALAGATSAEAQTKEFLEAFNQVKHLVGLPNSSGYKDIEVVQYPAEMLRTMSIKEPSNSQNILGNLKVIYQVKIPLSGKNKTIGNGTYHRFYSLIHQNRKPKLYEQVMCQTTKGQEVSVYKAIRKKSNQPSEFIILIRNNEKALVCDIVGYLDVKRIMNMLSPELKNYVNEDTLSISNK